MSSTILITGGAGYIGSHTVRLMDRSGYKLVVLDNLVYGHPESIRETSAELVVGEMSDEELLERIFTEHEIGAVIHFAAYAYVGESVTDPAKYYHNNTVAPMVLLDAMRKHGCEIFIFSSTCATYGNPESIPIDEQHPQNPINPYGMSKRMLERILIDYEKPYGIRSARLRYFNACGCASDGSIGEDHDPETHLIPLVLMTLTGERESITVFGTDYDTPDGTCIRDYIHVEDLARAHILALEDLLAGGKSFSCNLGTGRGVSVKEIIDKAEAVTGQTIPVVYGNRRPGDPPQLVGDPSFAQQRLGWEAEFKDVQDSIASAWAWIDQSHGGRYPRASEEAPPSIDA